MSWNFIGDEPRNEKQIERLVVDFRRFLDSIEPADFDLRRPEPDDDNRPPR